MSAGVVPSNEYLISSTVLSTATPTITFDVSSFVGVYKHFQIVYSARSDKSGSAYSNLALRLNGDEGSNYRAHRLESDGTGPFSGAENLATRMLMGAMNAANATTGCFTAGVIDILDPLSAAKNTTVRCFSGEASNANYISLRSALWINTAVVTSITVLNWDAANYVAGSRFSLYGVTA
jgi:hypothetical protein